MKWEDVKKLNDFFLELKEKEIDIFNLLEIREGMAKHPDYEMEDIDKFNYRVEEAIKDYVMGFEVSDYPFCEYWVWHPSAVTFMETKGVILVNVWFKEYPNITEFERPKGWKEPNSE